MRKLGKTWLSTILVEIYLLKSLSNACKMWYSTKWFIVILKKSKRSVTSKFQLKIHLTLSKHYGYFDICYLLILESCLSEILGSTHPFLEWKFGPKTKKFSKLSKAWLLVLLDTRKGRCHEFMLAGESVRTSDQVFLESLH